MSTLKRNSKPNARSTAPLFLFLLGALSFNLSSLPGGGRGPASSGAISMSSSEGSDDDNSGTDLPCDMVDRLHHSPNGATCYINETFNGIVVGRSVSAKAVMGDDTDYLSPNPVKTQVKMIQVDMDIETECHTGCARGKRTVHDSFMVEMKDLANISDIIKSRFTAPAKKLAKAESEAEQKKARLEKCETDVKGEALSDLDQEDCKLNRMAAMRSDAKAAAYFEKNIRPDIEAMASSEDPAKRKVALAMLNQLNKNGVGGEFVKQSIQDLAQFSMYKEKAISDRNQILALPANDPRRLALIQQAQAQEAQANNYFQGRGVQVKSQTWPTGAGVDLGGAMGTDLQAYQSQLDSNFQSIVDFHQSMVAQNGQPGAYQPQVVNPAFTRGQPMLNYGGQQQGATLPATSQFPQQQQQQQPQYVAPAQGTTAAGVPAYSPNAVRASALRGPPALGAPVTH